MKNLKFILAITVFSIAILFSSCKKKEDTPTPTPVPVSIVSTWTFTDGIDSQGQPFTASPNSTLTFTANNTYTSTNNFTKIGTPNPNGFSSADNGTYSHPDSLIMNSNVSGLTLRAKVTTLTASKLIFKYYRLGGTYEVRFTK